jgi:hypothetical protein
MELGIAIIMLVSSAYNTNLAYLDVIMGKSFINNRFNQFSKIYLLFHIATIVIIIFHSLHNQIPFLSHTLHPLYSNVFIIHGS